MAKEPFATRLTSIWIGASFYWAISGFRKSFKSHSIEKFENRNMWTGYLLTVAFVMLLILFVF